MIEIKNLTKAYGAKPVLSNLNWNFPDSGLICLLGASGCGKSTLLNLIAGFDSDYIGNISVLHTDINAMNDDELSAYRRNNIGFIFQDYNLLSGYTVLENILLACGENANENIEHEEKARTLLKRLDLLDKIQEKVENLSGGQKQRVAIARALIGKPSIILADEPTGALDRKNSTEIMKLLKEIAQDCLVLVITHDPKICEFADEIVSIKDGKLIGNERKYTVKDELQLKRHTGARVSVLKRGLKNFKVHFKRYIAVSLAISIGVLAFILSLSFSNVMEKSVSDFKEKNTAFNNGYIEVQENASEILSLLQGEPRIENVYEQYVIKDVVLSIDNQKETMAEKYPMPKSTENMSYGVMPKALQNQIALSPSLAKKFANDIKTLIGKTLILSDGKTENTLTISGIFNAGYDDFFVSSDIEKELYKNMENGKPHSISYDVKTFEDIVPVTQMLDDKNIKSKTVVNEVRALQSTFENLNRLFIIVSILILIIALFTSGILLVKLQNGRYRESGLLSALGYRKRTIRGMIAVENAFLSVMAAIFNAVLIGIVCLGSVIFKLDVIITAPQIILSTLATGIIVIFIAMAASYKLINTDPAQALRK